jgi:ribose transport system substrate-binding protein
MRLMPTIAIGAALVAVASCGATGAVPTSSSPGNDRGIRLMLVQGVQGDEFYISLACGAAERARAAGVTLDVEAPAKFDASLQAPIVAAVIAKRPDAVLIAPTDRQVMVEPLRRMRAAGITVIEVDTGVVDGDVSASSVASDNLLGGRMAARSLIKLTGGKGSYLVINVKPGISTTDERQEGFEAEIAKVKGVRYLGTRFSDDDPAKAGEIVSETLARHPGLTGIFATNGFNAAGAAIALRGASAEDRVKIVGFDAGPDQVRDLREDVVQSLVVQKPHEMGVIGVEQALAAIEGRPTTDRISTGFVVATKSNLDDPPISRYLYKSRC